MHEAFRYRNLSVMEQVYFDTVGHALETWHEYPVGYRKQMLEEAEYGGRTCCTNDDVRVIFKCMDLGLSPRECVNYLTDQATGGWFITGKIKLSKDFLEHAYWGV